MWYDPAEYSITGFGSQRWAGSGSRCHSVSLSAPPGESLPEGGYGLGVFAGGTLRLVSIVETSVGDPAAAGALTIRGRILDADTGSPIEGGFFFLLKPGVEVASWYSDRDERDVAASGVTDAEGRYALQPAVAPGLYGVVAEAFGFQPWGGHVRIDRDLLSDLALAPLE